MKDVKDQYKDYLDSAEGTEKYNRFKEILYGQDDSLVLKLFTIIYPLLQTGNNLSVLDVGGGDGKRLRHLINLFGSKGAKIKAELVEPSRVFTKNCQKALKKQKYSIEVTLSTFEKFTTRKRYDLIILIHSIYTFRNYQYLEKIKTLLKSGGLAVFVVNDSQSFLAGLKKITDTQFQSHRNEVDALLQGLAKYKHSVHKFDTCFSEILNGNKLNRNSELILEWIAMNSLTKIPAEIRKKAEIFFQQGSEKGIICEKEVVVMTNFY